MEIQGVGLLGRRLNFALVLSDYRLGSRGFFGGNNGDGSKATVLRHLGGRYNRCFWYSRRVERRVGAGCAIGDRPNEQPGAQYHRYPAASLWTRCAAALWDHQLAAVSQ